MPAVEHNVPPCCQCYVGVKVDGEGEPGVEGALEGVFLDQVTLHPLVFLGIKSNVTSKLKWKLKPRKES